MKDSEKTKPDDSEVMVPPEEELTAPPILPDVAESNIEEHLQDFVSPWLVVALNRRVNRDWEELLLRASDSSLLPGFIQCPYGKKPMRVFPLKGKRYKGAWEYEVTSGDRILYVPNLEKRQVLVYYAGKHPKVAPTPP